ncbi:type II toxin-antitoxin system HicA family toxin [Pseudomonas protegens]|uniref:type II toxin-antitoxin system HicA family toxin n=1 Tax=Pseudomonas protegens TaxID=380021 RepID=UPI00383A162F
MSQIEKVLEKLTKTPAPRDFTWAQLQKVMKHFGYKELEGNGSRKKFVHPGTKHKVLLHKRHPDSTLIGAQIEDIIEALKSQGYLND